MGYRILADAAMVAHFAFLAYLVVGGFVAWRWRRTIWLHVAVVTWGLGIVLLGLDCPLTALETWARRSAGQEGLPPGGFIDHYLTGVVYPRERLELARALVALSVVVSWLGFVLRGRVSARRAAYTPDHLIAPPDGRPHGNAF